jgi:arabinofuranosyltransferase
VYSNLTIASSGSPHNAGTVRLVRASLLVLFTYVFLANAWLGDDAHITFRVVWNFIHGYGFTYNPDERVQAFTHPLWAFVITAAHFITREFSWTVTAVSWAFDIAAGVLLLRRTRTIGGAALLVLWLLSSKALVDYTSSGLEYPLSYFLLALFYVRYLDRLVDVPVTGRELRWFVLVASLAFVNRPDAVLLYAVPLAEMVWRSLRDRGWKMVGPALVGALPAIIWLTFATFYYGFPLPNTYYAKVANGIPAWLQRQQGLAYLLNSIRYDPITIGTIALAFLFAWGTRGPARRALLSAALSVAYTVNIGGDFMSGRFFAMPFLVAVAAMVPEIDAHLAPWLTGGLVLYNVLNPIAPIKTSATYDGAWPWRTQNGIKDERGFTHQESNLLGFAPFRTLPDTPFARDGISFRASEQKAVVYCCIGLYGLNAGPAKHVIDENALSDPLLARLPVSPRVYFEFWASHYFRDVPDGYVESNEHDKNLLTDPLLRDYYDRLRNVTRGSLFRLSRFTDIWALNVGRSSDLSRAYEKRRPIELSIRAVHDRFQTDVGERDLRAGVLRSTGRSGYLEFGPGIPIKAGAYRVRWIGTVEAAPATALGYVEVWNGADRLDRQPVTFSGTDSHHLIAQIDFRLPEGSRALDYRFWVNTNVRVSLERVEIYSANAVPLGHEPAN